MLRRILWCWFIGACLALTACPSVDPYQPPPPGPGPSPVPPPPPVPAVVVTWEAWSSVAVGATTTGVTDTLGLPRSDVTVEGYRVWTYAVNKPAVGVVSGIVRFSSAGTVVSRVEW